MDSDTFLREAAGDGIARGGELYIPVAGAAAFLKRIADADLVILGIEAMSIEARITRAYLDLILDLSDIDDRDWPAARRESIAEAEQFLASLPDRPSLHVTFTLRSREEAGR